MSTPLTLEAWYSPAARCWRVEDGDMHTYQQLDEVVAHLQRREAQALVSLRWPKADELERALQRAGITVTRRT
jgi:hypothetical protein